MTNAVNTPVAPDMEDPDAPVADQGFVGNFVISAYVDVEAGTVTPTWGAENDARIIAQCKNYGEKSGNYSFPMWFMEAEGISVVRADGTPFRQSDIIKLRSKGGDRLGSNQAHAKLASRFMELGVSASYTKTGEPNTSIGHTFRFATTEIPLGQGFKKAVKLFPQEMFEDGYVYDGEVRTVKPRDGDAGAPADGNTSNQLSEADAIAAVKAAFDGHTGSELMDIVLDPASGLANVVTVLGVPLLDTATDESIVAVLVENKVMKLDGDFLVAL